MAGRADRREHGRLNCGQSRGRRAVADQNADRGRGADVAIHIRCHRAQRHAAICNERRVPRYRVGRTRNDAERGATGEELNLGDRDAVGRGCRDGHGARRAGGRRSHRDHRRLVQQRRRRTKVQPPVQPVRLVIGPRGVEQRVVGLVVGVVAEGDPPQARRCERRAAGTAQRADIRAGRGVEAVDAAVAEVADEQCVAQRAVVGRRKCETPRRIEPAAGRDQVPHEGAVHVVDVDEAESEGKTRNGILRTLSRQPQVGRAGS